MEKSIPLFNKILETNHLIKGRLGVKDSDLKKIYIALHKDDKRLRNKQSQQEKIIKNQINKCNAIKVKRKHNLETLQKSFYPISNKVSLIYKKQKSSHYIKARFYWGGKQREVQVGSIPIVIEIINRMIFNKVITDFKQVKNLNVSWGQINKSPRLTDAIKFIAALKAQEYILRRLLKNKRNSINNKYVYDKKSTNGKVEETYNGREDMIVSERDHTEDVKGVEWYERWRRENL